MSFIHTIAVLLIQYGINIKRDNTCITTFLQYCAIKNYVINTHNSLRHELLITAAYTNTEMRISEVKKRRYAVFNSR